MNSSSDTDNNIFFDSSALSNGVYSQIDDLPAILNSVTINAGSDTVTIDADNHRAFMVGDGTNAIDVTFNALVIQNAVAKGGDGVNIGNDNSGGGGAGFGGALFVNSNANVIVDNVQFLDNQAKGGGIVTIADGIAAGGSLNGIGRNVSSSDGGAGEGGGRGGPDGANGADGADGGWGDNAGNGGDGGDGFYGSSMGDGGSGGDGGNGSDAGFAGGGGAGGKGGTGGDGQFGHDGGHGGNAGNGGDAGFGGGAGAGIMGGFAGSDFGNNGADGGNSGNGGNAGFGGGAGTSGINGGVLLGNATGGSGGVGGSAGFGGGSGASGGGGGAGFGGAVFVRDGGSLTIKGDSQISGGSVQGGIGLHADVNGQAAGSGIFLDGSNLAYDIDGDKSTFISDDIVDGYFDDTSHNYVLGPNGAGSITKDGDGELTLSGNNQINGGITANAGTINNDFHDSAGAISGARSSSFLGHQTITNSTANYGTNDITLDDSSNDNQNTITLSGIDADGATVNIGGGTHVINGSDNNYQVIINAGADGKTIQLQNNSLITMSGGDNVFHGTNNQFINQINGDLNLGEGTVHFTLDAGSISADSTQSTSNKSGNIIEGDFTVDNAQGSIIGQTSDVDDTGNNQSFNVIKGAATLTGDAENGWFSVLGISGYNNIFEKGITVNSGDIYRSHAAARHE